MLFLKRKGNRYAFLLALLFVIVLFSFRFRLLDAWNGSAIPERKYKEEDFVHLFPGLVAHESPQGTDSCIQQLLRHETFTTPRDFFRHPVLVLSGQPYAQMTRMGCEIPCFYFHSQDAIWQNRADGWLDVMYELHALTPGDLPCEHQHNIIGTMESPVYYPGSFGPRYEHGDSSLLDAMTPSEVQEYLKRADFPYKEKSWYANVRLDSVVTLSYFEVMLDNIEESSFAERDHDVVAVISNCGDQHPVSRITYINKMIESTPDLKIEFYGACGPLGRYPGDKNDLMRRTKFLLAFENSAADDYLTEKFVYPFIVGAVPIVYGAPNVMDYEPGPDAMINAYDHTPEELGQILLKAVSSEKEYMKYHKWRLTGLYDQFKAFMNMARYHSTCRYCIRLADSWQLRYGETPTSARGLLIRERNYFYFYEIPMPEPRTVTELHSIIYRAFNISSADVAKPKRIFSVYSAYALQEAAQKDNSVWINTDRKVAALEVGFKLEVIFV